MKRTGIVLIVLVTALMLAGCAAAPTRSSARRTTKAAWPASGWASGTG